MVTRVYAAAAAAKSLQSCPTLCDPRDGSPPGSPVPGILQARTLEWVAISFSNAWKWKVKVKSLNHSRLFATPWTAAYQAPLSMDFPGKSTGVGCHCLLQQECIHVSKPTKLYTWIVCRFCIPDFPGGSDGKASVYNAGDLGSIPGLGRSPGERNGNPLQDYCLENPTDGGAW